MSTRFSRINWVIAAVKYTLTGMSLSDSSTQPSEIYTHSPLSTVLHNTLWLLKRHNEPSWILCIPLPYDRQHYLSCLLGKVFLQNLGLAAGEERGLEEVQQDRKTKQQQKRERKISTKGRKGKLLEKKESIHRLITVVLCCEAIDH